MFEKNNLENSKETKMQNDLAQSLETIHQSGLFNEEYLKNITLVPFTKKEVHKFKAGKICKAKENEFNWNDFAYGKRTDFVAIEPKNYLINRITKFFLQKDHLDVLFFENALSYDEFITHELAHNIFDIEYNKKYGVYKEKEGLTDVSEEYREKIKSIIIPLLKKYQPNIKPDKFPFGRQQIAEIFAFIHEREFCKRADQNLEMHEKLSQIVGEFSKNPEKTLEEFNQKNNKSFFLDEIYEENHTLSIIIAPALEKEYPNWEDRKNIFWK